MRFDYIIELCLKICVNVLYLYLAHHVIHCADDSIALNCVCREITKPLISLRQWNDDNNDDDAFILFMIECMMYYDCMYDVFNLLTLKFIGWQCIVCDDWNDKWSCV